MYSSFSSGSDMTVFKSKAGAMSFAILMNTTINSEGQRVIDYDETQKLFDFICASVNLPDVERDAMGDMVDALKEVRRDSPPA
jgi:hypothetical protein